MHVIRRSALILALAGALQVPVALAAQEQEVAPFFEQVPAVMYETYTGTTSNFGPYFRMLVEKYADSDAAGWAIYREGPKVSYRITVLPDGMQSLMDIQRARQESFQGFTEEQVALWNTAWQTRQVVVYNAAPAMSIVPDGFSLDDIRRMPYHQTTVYYLKWDQAGAFREAMRRRAELERAAGAGADGTVAVTVWNGGIGTQGQVVMVRIAAESQRALMDGATARRERREPYIDEWRELGRTINDASWQIERHDQTRANGLSWPAIEP